jgi:preprotein translocase subunit SecG
MSHLWTDVFCILFALSSVFLIFIVLLQRGRGGGLAGAFGATGGQSAFGTKAGDIFTRITIGVFAVWLILAAATGFAMRAESHGRFNPEAPIGEPEVAPANPPKQGGAQTNPFEAGDLGAKHAPAAKGTTGKGSAPSAAPAKSSSSVTPPATSTPASNAKKEPAPTK